MDEVVSHKEQRLVVDPGQRVGKTIAKIEMGAVSAAAPISSVCLSCDPRLLGSYRLNSDIRKANKFIQVCRKFS